MEKTFKSALTVSVTAAADLVKHRFIGFDGDYCGANEKCYGVSEADTASGQQCPLTAYGEALVETAGAISQGAKVASDANGKAVAFSTGEFNGYAVDAASGSGELIRVLLR